MMAETTRRLAHVWLTAAASTLSLAVACGGADTPETGGPTAFLDCVDLTVNCPDSLALLGESGAFSVESTEVQWTSCGGKAIGPMLYFALPDDITGLSVTVEQGSTPTGLALLQVGDVVQVEPSLWGQGPYTHDPKESPAGTVGMPIDDETAPEGGACLAILPVAADASGGPGTVHVVTKRGEGDKLIDLNLVVVEGTQVEDADLEAAIESMRAIYTNAGVADIGDVRLFTTNVTEPLIAFDGPDINRLRSFVPDSSEPSTNVFFVTDFIGEMGTLGGAAGIPGPIGVHGTAGSGVVLAVNAHLKDGNVLDTQMLGETIAHELGHQLGLAHTTESGGEQHDFLADTPECDASHDADGDGEVSAEECADVDGNHMMFWTSGTTPQTQVSPIQTFVLNSSAAVR